MDTNQPSKIVNNSFGIYHDLIIKGPIEKVFQAVSEPNHLIHWWPQTCTGYPELGQEYNFYFTKEYDWYGKVTKCIANQCFHITMTKSDIDWDATTFGFEMEENNGSTVLHFTHLNWPHCNAHYRIASFCWAILLKGLKDYVEKGIILPFEERS